MEAADGSKVYGTTRQQMPGDTVGGRSLNQRRRSLLESDETFGSMLRDDLSHKPRLLLQQ